MPLQPQSRPQRGLLRRTLKQRLPHDQVTRKHLIRALEDHGDRTPAAGLTRLGNLTYSSDDAIGRGLCAMCLGLFVYLGAKAYGVPVQALIEDCL